MNITEPFIHRPVMTTLVMVAIVVIGMVAFWKLPVSNLPDVDYPTINVEISYPGASPENMANTVATPLEKEFMTIPGITYVTSSSILGSTTIVLEFEVSKSMDSAAQDVEAAISRAKALLPPDLPNDPTYRKVNPSDTPIIYIALTSNTLRTSDLYTYANTFIGQQLSMINGVAQVITYGSPYAVRIQVNPNTLASYNLTLTDVARAIINSNPYLPTGELIGSVQAPTILTEGQLEKASDYNPVIIAYRNQAPVRIRDVGQAIDSVKNDKVELHYIDQDKDQPTVVLAVQRQPGANTVEVADRIHNFLPKLIQQLPASVQVHIVFDRSISIRESVEEVEFTLIIALALVVLVIFLYLGKLTDTIIPSLVLPVSVIGTFIFMYLLGYSINNLSLLALILAAGFIIDDAIVVLENIVRYVEAGKTPWEAALIGSKQIGFTILSMTLSLIAAFIPLIFMGGLIGKILQEFAMTLMIITLLSGIISLTLTPMLCSRFISAEKEGKTSSLGRLASGMNEKLLNIYRPALAWMLERPSLGLLIGLLSVVISAYYFYTLPTDFIPDDDIGFIIGYTQAEQGTSPSRMHAYQADVVQTIRQNPAVETIVSISSSSQYRNGIGFIRLKPRSERAPILDVVQNLYQQLGKIPGINTFLKNIPLIDLSIGTESKGSYQYTLQSINSEPLYAAAEKFIERVKKSPNFQGVSSDLEVNSPQVFIKILRDRTYSLGISAEEIENALSLGYAGGRVTRIRTPIDQYDVIVELEPRFQEQSKGLADLYVRSSLTNQLVPLNAIVEWREGIGPASINHIAQFPAVTISFNLAPNVPLSQALEELRTIAEETLPSDVYGDVRGAAQTFEESMQGIYILLLVAVFAIYIILGILYESFIHPLTILSTLPPATFGAMITLDFLGYPLSLYAYLGVILLIGIVKKNGIIMIDYAIENERQHGQSPKESIFQACLVRFRPIMMTTVTSIMGALPIALAVGSGAASRRPLGWVIVGGLFFSQLITLFITPVIYLYMDRLNHFLHRKLMNPNHASNNELSH